MAQQQDQSKSVYPFVGYYFRAEFLKEVGGAKLATHRASFQEVSGLSVQVNVEEVKEGGENGFSHRLPSPAKFGNLVLKRGMFEDDELFKWCKDAIEDFEFAPMQVIVSLLNQKGEPLKAWMFDKAYPVKWSLSGFNSTQNAVVVESVELAYQRFTVKQKASGPQATAEKVKQEKKTP